MRGRTTCPHCGENYTVDIPDGTTENPPTKCPSCGYSFTIDVEGKYSWEDGKTPLIPPSLHLKPRSLKPKIAGVLLIITFLFGVLTWGSLYTNHEDLFKEASTGIPSKVSSFQAVVVNETGAGVPQVMVTLEGHNITAETNENGTFNLKDVPWGYQTLTLTRDNYITVHVNIFIFPFDLKGFNEKYTLREGTGETIEPVDSEVISAINTMISLLSILFIIFSVAALIAGICSLQRKFFLVCLIGSILGLLTMGLGLILSIIALVLIVLSRDEFRKKTKEIIY